MADPKEKDEDIAVVESQDGSATVDLPENLALFDETTDENEQVNVKNDVDEETQEETSQAEDDDDFREARKNRRKAKRQAVKATVREKNLFMSRILRENEQMRRDIEQLKRNTKAEQVTRIDKNIEDAQVQLEYAKMKLSEATSNNDGQAMVEAQTLWQSAQDQVRQLTSLRNQADQELRYSQVAQPQMDPEIQRNAARWMKRNSWYNPNTSDPDSKVAKSIDEQMSSEGWDPTEPDYWDELDSRLQRVLPHRYNDSNDDDSRYVRRPRNVVGSSGREASAAYGGSNRTQFVLSPERVKAMKDLGAWDNPERKAKMIKNFIEYDRRNGVRN